MDDNAPKDGLSEIFERMCAELEIGIKPPKMTPSVRFEEGLDKLVVLNEQVGHYAMQIDKHLDLLWHGERYEVVGINFQGLEYILRTNSILVPDAEIGRAHV
jgi:hypothetical protein